MVTTEELESAFANAGKDYGMANVSASFGPFRDLKVRWVRTMDEASFEVSDYLREADSEIVEGLARTIFARMRGMDAEYPEDAIEYLTSPGFRSANQTKYIERSRMIDDSCTHDVERLYDSYRRLLDCGMLEPIEDLKLFWTKDMGEDAERMTKMGQSSCLMRVVIMNSALDRSDIPDEVLDYCLLHEIANIRIGFGQGNDRRETEIRSILDSYPHSMMAQDWLEAAKICT